MAAVDDAGFDVKWLNAEKPPCCNEAVSIKVID
jgi:hypothetical protein